MAYRNFAIVENKLRNLQFRTYGGNVVAAIRIWLKTVEAVNGLMARELPFSRMDKDRRVGSGMLTLVADAQAAHEGNKLGTRNKQALKVIIANCGPSVSVATVCQNTGLTPAGDVEPFNFFTAVVGLWETSHTGEFQHY